MSAAQQRSPLEDATDPASGRKERGVNDFGLG
jgi:hypothetical protein